MKHVLKRGMSILLTGAIALSGMNITGHSLENVQAAASNEPSVTKFATTSQLMTGFDLDGTEDTVGKVYFGTSDGTGKGTPLQWYIAGRDSANDSDNIVLFSAQSLGISDFDDKGASNRYAASTLELNLAAYQNNGSKSRFTSAENNLMNATDLSASSVGNTAEAKLYALNSANSGSSCTYATAGARDTIKIDRAYWGTDDFWLRSPDSGNSRMALFAFSGKYVDSANVNTAFSVVPAFDLNLSSVLFASAASAATASAALGDTMIFRVDAGEGENARLKSSAAYTSDGVTITKDAQDTNVYLYVQGKDGDEDWVYSKEISASGKIDSSTIHSGADLSKCRIWLETASESDRLTYAVMAVTDIPSVAITGIDAPKAASALDQTAVCATTGVATTAPAVTYTADQNTVSGKAGYNRTYTASMTLTPDLGYVFKSDISKSDVTINGSAAASVTLNASGTLTVTYTFPATAKARLTGITKPADITGVANGTVKTAEALGLPDSVAITTEDASITSAKVQWDLENPAEGTYDPSVLDEQTFTVKGTVILPTDIDRNGIDLTTTIRVTAEKADTASAPKASVAAGTYTKNQSVTLSTATAGADIYYTTIVDGKTTTSGKRYTGPITISGSERKSVKTTIRAIAVKNGMFDSKVAEFSYTIEAADTTAPTARITIGTEQWNKFWNNVNFEIFSKEAKTAVITAEDSESFIETVEYYLSDKELTQAEAKADTIAWKEYPQDGISLSANTRAIIYAKATDSHGNYTIVNSGGVVVYTDSAKDTANLEYIKNVSSDLDASVKLNGNTISGIKNGEKALTSGKDYTVGTDGKITFHKTYLNTLAIGSYTLTISYNPMGEKYAANNVNGKDTNEAPKTTSIALKIRKPKLISITAPDAVKGVPNGTKKTAEALGLPDKVTIKTENKAVTSAEVTWDLKNLASGTYDPALKTEQTFTVTGAVSSPAEIDPNGVSLKTTIKVTVSAAGAATVPTASAPKTGDGAPVVWLLLLLLVSGTGFVVIVKRRKRNKE